MADRPPTAWARFERDLRLQAKLIALESQTPFSHRSQKDVFEDLSGLAAALSALVSRAERVKLVPAAGALFSGLSEFNEPALLSLLSVDEAAPEHVTAGSYRRYVDDLRATFERVAQLGRAAQRAAANMKPRPGNSAERTKSAQLTARVGDAFVRMHVKHFKTVPAMSNTGPLVEAMDRMLETAFAQAFATPTDDPRRDSRAVLRAAITRRRRADAARMSD
jgi:hypothetical protein